MDIIRNYGPAAFAVAGVALLVFAAMLTEKPKSKFSRAADILMELIVAAGIVSIVYAMMLPAVHN